MPKVINPNRDNALSVLLLDLRRHLMTCDQCRAAIKCNDDALLCARTGLMILGIAKRWDANIPGRLAARRGNQRWIYPCPSPVAHGSAYALTAEACYVTSTVDALF